jgi:hypothetical protein
MTVTDLPRTAEPGGAESPAERLAKLNAMLDDPQWAGHEDDIRKAIEYLTATSVLGA